MERKETTLDALFRGAADREANRPGDPTPSRAYLWGWTHGVGARPAFVAALLDLRGGVALAERALPLLERLPESFPLPERDVEGVVELESLVSSWEALGVARATDPAFRRSLDLLIARCELSKSLPRLLALFVAVLSRGTALCPLRETARRLVETFRELPASLVEPLLGVLETRRESLWGPGKLPRKPRRATNWETRRWNDAVAPLVTCLRRTRDLRLTLRIEAIDGLLEAPPGRKNARRYAALLQLLPSRTRLAVAAPLAQTLSQASNPACAARGLATLYQAYGSDEDAFGELVQLTTSWRGKPEYGPAIAVLRPLLQRPTRPTVKEFCALLREVAVSPKELGLATDLADLYFAALEASSDPDLVNDAFRLASKLAWDDPALASRIFQATAPLDLSYDAIAGADTLREYAGMRRTAARALVARTSATLAILAELSKIDSLPRAEQDTLETTVAVAPNRPAWAAALAVSSQVEDAMYELAALGVASPPAGIRKAASLPTKLQREADFLAARPDAAARRENLLARLANREALDRSVECEVLDRLDDALAEARLVHLRRSLDALWANRARVLLGESLAAPTPELLHAVRLAISARDNRRPLARLLREPTAIAEHPKNVAFAARMIERGVLWETWRARRQVTVKFAGVDGDSLTLYAVENPLRVLQMGTLFDTCLAVDGCNAFSAVANAVDVNKRVVFAEDGLGKVVARQLLALTDDAKLLGFAVYNHLPSERHGALRSLFRAWGAALATDCGATLATEGGVSTLVSRAWYDDGAVAWWPQKAEVA